MEIDTNKIHPNCVLIIITDDEPIKLRGLVTGLAHYIKIQCDAAGVGPEEFAISPDDDVKVERRAAHEVKGQE